MDAFILVPFVIISVIGVFDLAVKVRNLSARLTELERKQEGK